MKWFPWRHRLRVTCENHRYDGAIEDVAAVWIEPGDSLSVSDESKQEKFRLIWVSAGHLRLIIRTDRSLNDAS